MCKSPGIISDWSRYADEFETCLIGFRWRPQQITISMKYKLFMVFCIQSHGELLQYLWVHLVAIRQILSIKGPLRSTDP